MDNGRLAKNYDRKMFLSGVSVCQAVVIFWGHISVGSDEIGRDHMYDRHTVSQSTNKLCMSIEILYVD